MPSQQQAATGPDLAGTRFRGFVAPIGKDGRVEDLTLRPVGPRDVVIKAESAAVPYTDTWFALAPVAGVPIAVPGLDGPYMVGQGCVGRVVQVGSHVKRVRVGDRAALTIQPQCGVCFQCINGRSDWCQVLSDPLMPFAEMDDGTVPNPLAPPGGCSEYVVGTEDWVVPLFTDRPADEIMMLATAFGFGLSAAFNTVSIFPGSNVVVWGCGPVGLGAVRAAKLRSAGRIIAVEPIPERRELALRMGAHIVLDPNAEGPEIVEKILGMCKGPTGRIFSGGRFWGGNFGSGRDWPDDFNVPRGADFVIEAVGADSRPPKRPAGPDPTGVEPLLQSFNVTRAGGHVCYMGMGHPPEISMSTFQLVNRGRTIHPIQTAMHIMRDIPRYVTLLENGDIDLSGMITRFPLEEALEAHRAVAERTVVAACLHFD